MKNDKGPVRILSITAAMLFMACLFIDRPANGQISIKENDFAICTFATNQGTDALYIMDTRREIFGVFAWNSNQRTMEPVAIRPIIDAFGGR